MNKKIFGIRIGTILQFLLSLALAVVIWFIVQYFAFIQDNPDEDTQAAVSCESVEACARFEV